MSGGFLSLGNRIFGNYAFGKKMGEKIEKGVSKALCTSIGLAKTTTRNPIFPENRRFRQKSKGGSPGKLEKSPFLTPKMSISRGDYEKNSNFQKMSISRGESGKMTFFDQKLNEDSATPKTTPKPRAPYRVYHFWRRKNRAPKTTNTTTLNLF